MKKFFPIALASLLLTTGSAIAQQQSASVLSVGDGDTIRVRQGSNQTITVRLSCVDAPEIAQQPWGYAIIYPQYFSGCNASRGQYQQAEAGARQNRLAFWSQPNPVAPWDFRSGRRNTQPPAARPAPTSAPSPAAGTAIAV
ncbi:thermonuclease family protein [Argonema galeatum]|uniref:thermonuclease family protein n=1 Tax=Argonema galeatum TaxID=2942762 RepID=UPI0020129775|nr:thermonuclease family protein [Argonema galeatum]MCL1467905.1 thermonuclease family protein [Argonema galeatum A003/A1]